MGASVSCKMSYCLRVISLRCGSRSDKDVASSIARRRLKGPEEAVAGAVVGMKATPLKGPDHLGPELISERLVTGSVLVASDLPEFVFPPVSALCASLRSLSVTYITDRVGKPASYAMFWEGGKRCASGATDDRARSNPHVPTPRQHS